ncbi:hypothetical protein [Nocardia sp. NPDC051463]|uniref:hypothetical protein n=1 Tax=Nocardia sp. NPDC051463 TaxID=3154845 RepID=UPI003415E38D
MVSVESDLCTLGARNSEPTLAEEIIGAGMAHELDRDHNAAVNLASLGEQQHVSDTHAG